MTMTRDEFVALLTPERMKFVWESIQGGLADYANSANYSAVARLDHTPSIRAAIRNGHIVGRAKRSLATDPNLGVRYVRKGSRDLFYFANLACISLKKLDDNLRPSNYPTRQATHFNAQLWPEDTLEALAQTIGTATSMAQLTLWESGAMPGMTNIVAGYLANAAETAFEIYVVCPDGEGMAWTLRLNAKQIAEFAVAPTVAVAEVTKQVQKRRVRVRPGATEKQGTDGSVE